MRGQGKKSRPELKPHVFKHRAFIGLGANLGNREGKLLNALARLERTFGISLEHWSSFIETEPVGGPPNQPRYLNGAAALSTVLTPRQLLARLLKIELQMGRDRSSVQPNSPRLIDLDLLLYDDQVLDESGLVVPHPRMHQREFVLRPLSEIAPDVVHPVLQKTVRELLLALG